ncbi:MAG: hypothetical protein RR047_00800 [Bacilli bacterium]
MEKQTKTILSGLALIALLLITVGASYAFFTYSKQGSKVNSVTTGTLTFAYNESEAVGNGITLTNAMPITDDAGKGLLGAGNIFDFTITASASAVPLNYSVAAIKQSGNLSEGAVKIYLTDITGTEQPSPLTVSGGVVKKYSELGANPNGGKTIYTGTFGVGTNNATKNFRLRMWVASDATNVTDGNWNYNNQNFQVKVGVYANS